MIGAVFAVLKWVLLAVAVIWGIGFALDRIGPTEPLDLPPAAAEVPVTGLDGWLAEREGAVPDLRAAARKRIVWAGAPDTRTPLSIVYLHGFTASAEEIRPVPDRMAAALGANLYFARLSGHGRDSAAMEEITANAFLADLAEAVAIGARIGERVILLGASTGGTLAMLAAADPALSAPLAGIAVMSPNLRMSGFGGRVAEWPFARVWGPALAGRTRSFEPVNAAHAEHWTEQFPTVSVAALGALTHHARGLDFAAMTVPALFLISTGDEVVDPRAGRVAAARWGAPSALVPVPMGPEDDPRSHVLAGDILSPSKTAPVVERLVDWARGL